MREGERGGGNSKKKLLDRNQAQYLDNWLHVLDQKRQSAVVLDSHVFLHVDVWFVTEWGLQGDALVLAVDHLGHLHW